MPAIAVVDTLVLPRIPVRIPPRRGRDGWRRCVTANRQVGGGDSVVRRPFPGGMSIAEADPFLLLDHMGPEVNGPGEAKGAPWHPHRGFETVSYVLDGEVAPRHQWRRGHDRRRRHPVDDGRWRHPARRVADREGVPRRGPVPRGPTLGQPPPAFKMTPPRYQSITRDSLRLLTSENSGALIRLIAGEIGGYDGPGSPTPPITSPT